MHSGLLRIILMIYICIILMFLQHERDGKPKVEVLGKYTICVHAQVYEKIHSDVVGHIRAAFAKLC